MATFLKCVPLFVNEACVDDSNVRRQPMTLSSGRRNCRNAWIGAIATGLYLNKLASLKKKKKKEARRGQHN